MSARQPAFPSPQTFLPPSDPLAEKVSLRSRLAPFVSRVVLIARMSKKVVLLPLFSLLLPNRPRIPASTQSRMIARLRTYSECSFLPRTLPFTPKGTVIIERLLRVPPLDS